MKVIKLVWKILFGKLTLKGDSVKEVLNLDISLNRNGHYYFIGYA